MRGGGFLTYSACLIAMIAVAVACGRDPELGKAMDRAEAVMNEHPDSALRILETHRPAENAPKSDLARHSLLTAMARDKSLPATDTTFKYLQRAIDYYAEDEHGTPDDRLRTFFYQGRIHMERGEYDKSMRAFQHGYSLKNEVADSMAFANTAYEQGKLYYMAHRIIEYCNNNKEASRIYEKLGNTEYEVDCLNEIGRAAIMMNDKKLADSVANVLSERISRHHELGRRSRPIILGCRVMTYPREKAEAILHEYENLPDNNDAVIIELADGYYSIGKMDKAAEMIDCISDTNMMSAMKYLSIKGYSYLAIGRNEEAAKALAKCVKDMEDWLYMLVSNDLSFADVHYGLETENLREDEKHKQTLIMVSSVVALLLLALIIVLLKLRNSRLRAKGLELTLENIRLKSDQIREERDELVAIMQKQEEEDSVMSDIMKKRIKMLDSLIAFQISNGKSYEKQYEKWKNKILSDRETFLKENRLAMTSAHPRFIRRLDEAGLNENEIECACLYALGLKGKEVGAYLEKKRHYHTVTEIRKKLNIADSRIFFPQYIRSILD